MCPGFESLIRHQDILMRTIAKLAFLLLSTSLVACESTNRLSDGSFVGVMTTQAMADVQIDGKQRRLAPVHASRAPIILPLLRIRCGEQ